MSNAAITRVTILLTEKKSVTFLDEITGNMSNKRTFINPNSPWTSCMKNGNYSTNKIQVTLYDDPRTCPCTLQFMHSSYVLAANNQISLTTKFPDFSLTLGLFPDFLLTIAEFHDISRFPKKIQKSSNPVQHWVKASRTHGVMAELSSCPLKAIPKRCNPRFQHFRPDNSISLQKQHKLWMTLYAVPN